VKEGKSEEPEAGINTLKTLKSWHCSWRKHFKNSNLIGYSQGNVHEPQLQRGTI
jgi:hypothetical protein